ncbi:DnaB-like helicase C-terminal domain-containing protein [Anaeroselena agilis]|uniref:DnaB-like helicase C-terminal domain-containing protein n=1 Tax=Anaeroselena agilis TaxID=3063788 RepID=A0ABU3NUZ7_9FIRM|nr:DnaB-like helicase C-terminal domain-containing protein [Selenomonadales bacterium 4137-cl]
MRDSVIVEEHIPCPDCGSSDARCKYSDGHFFCFSCKTYTKGEEEESYHMAPGRKTPDIIPPDALTLGPLKARGIMQETCQKFSYFTSKINGQPVQVANYYRDGQVVGQKIRWKDKTFRTFGEVGDVFYGQHLFPGGGKKLVVTEGEIDCLTVSQIQGNKYPVVSVSKGAGSAKKTFKANLEWLESFEEVIVMFDEDEAGRAAVKSVQGLLSPGKLKIATLPLKDPNDCLLAGKAEEVTRAIWNAAPYRPDGIINGRDLWDRLNKKVEDDKSVPLPWNIKLQTMTRGIRPGEIILVTAGSGIGKSTVVRTIAHWLATHEKIKVGTLMLEEPPERTAQGFMSLTLGVPVHLEWQNVPKEELKRAFDETLGPGNVVIYDHFGSIEGSNLINQMRYMAKSEGCKFLVLDHISIAISGLEGENERRILDNLMTALASLAQETGVGIIVISHLRKTDDKRKSHEEGGTVSLSDLRGSGALYQLSFTVIALERNQQEEDQVLKNVLRVRLLKCRHTGETGLAGYLWYDKEKDQLQAVEDIDAFIAENSVATEEEGSTSERGDF